MPAGQRDELELVAHLPEFTLELGDRLVVEGRLPVERRRAVVGQHLAGVLGVHRVGELLGLVQVRRAGLAPDEVAVRGVGDGPGDRGAHTGLCLVEALSGAAAGEERLVAVVHVAGDEVGRKGVGTCEHDCRNTENVGSQTGSGQGADVLLGRDEHLSTHVAALLLGGQLVLEVHAGGAGPQHLLHELVDVQGATESRFGVGHDRDHPVAQHHAVVL